MKRAVCLALLVCLLAPLLPVSAQVVVDERAYLLERIKPLAEQDIPKNPPGVHHYLLIGMDKWQNNLENLGYNDGLVLLTLDEMTGRVMVTSIIRDLLIIRPDGNPGRINRVIRENNVQALLDTINAHFGISVDKYMMIDWRHIMEVVDAVGGVSVPLTSDEIHYLKNWAVPVNSTEPVMDQPGIYHLNGFAAVIYMRIRARRASNDEDTQDFGRTYRVRLVLSNIADSLSLYDYGRAQELLSHLIGIIEAPFDGGFTYPGIRNNNIFVAGSVPRDKQSRRSATNITLADLFDALRIAFSMRGTKVEQCVLPFKGTVHPFTYANGAGQLTDFELNRKLFHEFMFPDTFMVTEGTP